MEHFYIFIIYNFTKYVDRLLDHEDRTGERERALQLVNMRSQSCVQLPTLRLKVAERDYKKSNARDSSALIRPLFLRLQISS